MKRRADGRYAVYKTVNGKKTCFYGSTPKEAILKAEQQEIKKEIVMFIASAEQWETEIRERIAVTTWRGYSTAYKNICEQFSNYKTSEVTLNDINIFISSLVRLKYAQKTIKTYIHIINQITGIKAPLPKNLPKEERQPATDEDVQKILNNKDSHFGLFAYLILHTGLRRGEALALKYSDIKNGQVTVNKAIYFDGNRPYVKSTKTKSGIRTVPVTKELELTGNGYIFGNNDLMSEQAYRRAYEHYKKESGVTCTPHQIRHAFCTKLCESCTDLKYIQYVMGHKTIQITMDIYNHVTQKKKDTQADTVRSLFV